MSCANGFVNMSTNWSWDLQKCREISPFITNSWIKWNRASMCLLFLWNTLFFIVLWLNYYHRKWELAHLLHVRDQLTISSTTLCDMLLEWLPCTLLLMMTRTHWDASLMPMKPYLCPTWLHNLRCFFDYQHYLQSHYLYNQWVNYCLRMNTKCKNLLHLLYKSGFFFLFLMIFPGKLYKPGD